MTEPPTYVDRIVRDVEHTDDKNLLFHQTAVKKEGYKVSGLHGYDEGRIMPLTLSTALPMYKYTLHDKSGKNKCVAGVLDSLSCSDRVCTGKFYERSGRRGCGDPDARMELHMDPGYTRVESMSIQHNKSDRNLDSLVTQNDNTLKVPITELPNMTKFNEVRPLCPEEQCNGYQLLHKDKVTAYMYNVTCDDRMCDGDLIIIGDKHPTHKIRLNMSSNNIPKGVSCRNPVFENVTCVRLKHNEQNSWAVTSRHCR